jgi:hypothetical protein
MIIKVPIYLEIESVNQILLPGGVEVISQSFSTFLKKEEFKTLRKSLTTHFGESFGTFKIILKDKALEILRTKK